MADWGDQWPVYIYENIYAPSSHRFVVPVFYATPPCHDSGPAKTRTKPSPSLMRRARKPPPRLQHSSQGKDTPGSSGQLDPDITKPHSKQPSVLTKGVWQIPGRDAAPHRVSDDQSQQVPFSTLRPDPIRVFQTPTGVTLASRSKTALHEPAPRLQVTDSNTGHAERISQRRCKRPGACGAQPQNSLIRQRLTRVTRITA